MDKQISPNVRWHPSSISRQEREDRRGHRGVTLWFTGLSGSGKSTVAHAVERALFERGYVTYVLDGDNVRHGLNGDLGFSKEDRTENIRRVGEVAKLFTDAGIIVLCAFVSPYRADRDRIRGDLAEGDFLEVYVKASLAECERRDPKGLYGRARAGEVTNLTGMSAPYEVPISPELVLDTEAEKLQESVQRVLQFLDGNAYTKGNSGGGSS